MDYDKDPAKARDYFTQLIETADDDDARRKEAASRLKELDAQQKSERTKAEAKAQSKAEAKSDSKSDKAARADKGGDRK